MNYERVYDRKLIVSILAAGLMSFCGIVVETAMNVTFPTLMKQFGIDTATVQWCTTGYLLVLSIVIPLSSFLKQRFRTKPLFLVSVGIFLIGTLLCGLSPSFAILLLGRMVQGVATGIALPLMMNIILEQAPFDKMGMLMGVAMLLTAIAPALGPVLGGIMVDTVGWRGIFFLLIPVLILSMVLGTFSIRQGWDTGKRPFPLVDWILLGISFVCLIMATSYLSVLGLHSPIIWGLFAGFVVFGFLFALHARQSAHPLIRLRILRYPAYVWAVLAIFAQQIVCLGIGYLIPNFPQLSWGVSSTVAGMLLLPGCIVGAIFSPICGRMLDKVGAKKPILLGGVLCIIGIGFGAFIACHSGIVILFTVTHVIYSFGLAFSSGNNVTYGLRQVSEDLMADGNAINNTVQQLAGGVGTAIVTTIVAISQNHLPDDLAQGTAIGTYRAFAVVFVVELFVFLAFMMVFRFAKKNHK